MRTIFQGVAGGVAAFGLFLISACGGGGGGGGHSEPALPYAGSTAPAVITPANATLATAAVLGGGDIIDITDELSRNSSLADGSISSEFQMLPFIATLRTALESTLAGYAPPAQTARAAAIRIDETEACYPSGSFTSKGSIDDQNGTGKVTITFNACQDGDTYMDGPVEWRIQEALLTPGGWMPLDSIFTFHTITLIAPEVNVLLGGTLRLQYHADGNSTLTLNAVLKDNGAPKMYQLEDVVTKVEYVDYYHFSETIRGRFYDSLYGYIDMVTLAPLLYPHVDPLYPLEGQFQLSGANGTRLVVTALPDAMARLELYAQSEPEPVSGEIPWAVIAKAGNDPGDADGDGMDDIWEAEHGLSNATYADASSDPDADGVSNYAEYLAKTDPNGP